MPNLLEAFFSHGEPSCAGNPIQESSTLNHEAMLYLHGSIDAAVQTSMLLQYGFTRAKAGHNVVLVLCGENASLHRPPIATLLPCSTCSVPVKTGSDNAVWSRIHIKYIQSSVELQRFVWAMQLMQEKCSVLLINGLERFFSATDSIAHVFQTLSYLFEARRYMAQSTGMGEVVLTGQSDASWMQDRRSLYRWCHFLQVRHRRHSEYELFHEQSSTDDDHYVEEDDDDGTTSAVVIIFEHLSPNSLPEGSIRLLKVIITH